MSELAMEGYASGVWGAMRIIDEQYALCKSKYSRARLCFKTSFALPSIYDQINLIYKGCRSNCRGGTLYQLYEKCSWNFQKTLRVLLVKQKTT